jgi:hypothetical protein
MQEAVAFLLFGSTPCHNQPCGFLFKYILGLVAHPNATTAAHLSFVTVVYIAYQ